MHWQPSASLANIKARAALYAQIRAFFAQRHVLEVETPVINRSTASEPQLASIALQPSIQGHSHPCFLQTSPEYPMKRLLAAGSGAIYQICKTFRDDERGTRHNPEFSMLEWYRPGFTLETLMNEVAELVTGVLGCVAPSAVSYKALFQQTLDIDPFTAPLRSLHKLARNHAGFDDATATRDALLDVLMACVIEPELGRERPVFVTHYPPSQASLARVVSDADGNAVAARFELYIDGLELANGYWELTDADEQRQRFEADNRERREQNLPEIPLDHHLLAALEAGLPESAGVALGLDRLLMVQCGAKSIDEVVCFPFERV